MNKHNRTPDIDMLLSALLVCSVIIGGFHHWALGADQKKPKKVKMTLGKLGNPLADVTNSKILEVIQPFIISESVDKIIHAIIGLRIDKALAILKSILGSTQHLLNRDDRATIIMGVAAGYADIKDKNRILDLLGNTADHFFNNGAPLLFLAARNRYPQVIPAVQKWYEAHAKKMGLPSLDAFELKALNYAVEKKDHDALDAMKQNGVAINKQRASTLLNDAVRLGVETSVIDELLRYGADINYAINGYTPLLHAIKNSDRPAVELLIQHGADVNKLGNVDVGNPRQVARDAVSQASQERETATNKNTVERLADAVNIENYLIEKGAND